MKLSSFLLVIGLFVIAGTINASHPGNAANVDPNALRMKEMVNELRALIRRGKQANAADRWFLRDLRRLAGKYDQPLYRILLKDDFRDGNYHTAPVWVVTSGAFSVTRHHALYSLTTHAAPEKKRNFKDALRDKLRKQLGRGGEQPPAMVASTSAIYTSVSVPGAFEVSYRLVPHRVQGRAVIHLFRGRNRNSGYKLVYKVQEDRWLLRYYDRHGREVLAERRSSPHAVQGKAFDVSWRRDHRGVITVRVNNVDLIKITDKRISSFSGLEYKNHNAEFSLGWIMVKGQL